MLSSWLFHMMIVSGGKARSRLIVSLVMVNKGFVHIDT